MGLQEFLNNNWFSISCLITIVTLTLQVSTKLNDIQNSSNKGDSELESDLKDTYTTLHEEIVELRHQVNTSHEELHNLVKDAEERRDDNNERMRIIMDGVEATLVSLHDDGHNGPVTRSLTAIQDYKSKKSAE